MNDTELTALALAADPDTPVADDAVSVWDVLSEEASQTQFLPSWYMPLASASRPLTGWRRGLALLVVAALVLITAYGLCNTYGQLPA